MLSVLCTSWQVQAHQPDLSSIILSEQGEQNWVLQVRSALTAFEYAIEDHYGAGSYTTPEEFQQLVVNFIRERISIRFNDTDAAELQNGMVKLGHETNVIFQLVGTPEAIRSLAVEHNSFSNIPHNQSVLMVYKKDFEKKQFMLNSTNGHSIRLEAGNAEFLVVEPDQGSLMPYSLLFAGMAVAAVMVLIFVYQKKYRFRFNSSILERA